MILRTLRITLLLWVLKVLANGTVCYDRSVLHSIFHFQIHAVACVYVLQLHEYVASPHNVLEKL